MRRRPTSGTGTISQAVAGVTERTGGFRQRPVLGPDKEEPRASLGARGGASVFGKCVNCRTHPAIESVALNTAGVTQAPLHSTTWRTGARPPMIHGIK